MTDVTTDPTTSNAHATAPAAWPEFNSWAWDVHAAQPEAVAQALHQRAPSLPPDEAGAGAIRLAEHVYVAHLHRPDALYEWLERLPMATQQSSDCAPAIDRARWVLAALAGEVLPPLPDAERWRGLQNVWAMWLAQGQALRAQASLQHERALALACPDTPSRRALAATCNNMAAECRLGARGNAAVDALMLAAADASHALWASAGTWVHVERAHYQLARCHAVLGQAAQALDHARACMSAMEVHADDAQADAFERFYALEALAWAQLAGGERALAAETLAHMRAQLAQVEDPESHRWAASDAQALEVALGV